MLIFYKSCRWSYTFSSDSSSSISPAHLNNKSLVFLGLASTPILKSVVMCYRAVFSSCSTMCKLAYYKHCSWITETISLDQILFFCVDIFWISSLSHFHFCTNLCENLQHTININICKITMKYNMYTSYTSK